MSAGDNHIAMLDADGTVWSTGHNYYGQLGTNNKTNYSIPQQMKLGTTTVLNNIKKVSAGSLHTLALAENGTVYSLGYNSYGQLGTRNTTNYMLPVTMVDSKGNTVTGVKDIEANGYTSILAIKPTTTGTEGNLSQTAGIYVTGYNNYGQLFNQDTKTLTSLTKVQEDKNIITMATTLPAHNRRMTALRHRISFMNRGYTCSYDQEDCCINRGGHFHVRRHP